MAQQVRVVVDLTDDLNGKEATQTVEYTWGGVDYVIDLTDANARRFERQMTRWVEHSRPAVSKPDAPTGDVKWADEFADPEPKAVRAWARDQGLPIGKTGAIPADIQRAYCAAHERVRTA